jgi:hypothetical protein
MNEKIRLLAEQAFVVTTDGKVGHVNTHIVEKFAELIVRECAGLFIDQKYMILNPTELFAKERVQALKDHDKHTVKKIKQHFGVE